MTLFDFFQTKCYNIFNKHIEVIYLESLSVKYRPKKFDDVIGQHSIVKILQKQIELNQFKNCYLFCGPSGCGKTTLARIFANSVNNGIGSPIEIDAASNNSVENVRNIVSAANERSIDSKYKIYIIDECHSLGNIAWQAFLKCIEEPPTFTIFIFATTEPQKIPATITNRCMRFDFQKINSEEIKNRLNFICAKENFTDYESTIDLISKMCKNQCRDAISLLDKVAAYSTKFDINVTSKILGFSSITNMVDLTNSIIDGNEKNALETINMLYENGVDLKLFVEQYLTFILDVLKYVLFKNISVTNISNNDVEKINSIINFNDVEKFYNYCLDKILDLKNMIKNDSNIKNTVEVIILQMCRLK